MTTLNAIHDRKQFDHALQEAADGERIIVERDGKPVAALVPVEDAEYMQRLEDERDIAAAEAVLARIESGESKLIPWEQVKAKWGD